MEILQLFSVTSLLVRGVSQKRHQIIVTSDFCNIELSCDLLDGGFLVGKSVCTVVVDTTAVCVYHELRTVQNKVQYTVPASVPHCTGHIMLRTLQYL